MSASPAASADVPEGFEARRFGDGMVSLNIRPVEPGDFDAWKPLWDGYNAFYGRAGATALPDEVTQSTWQRFFDPAEPVYGLVAVSGSSLVGLTHYLFHRSTSRIGLTCYLQDLFTLPAARGKGVGRALIEGVYASVRAQGLQRVYWQTHESNTAGRRLYDQVAENEGFIVYSHTVTQTDQATRRSGAEGPEGLG